MSATTDPIQQVVLNDEQVDAIIDYLIKAGMYDGSVPTDPEMRRTDAATMVYQARRARDNGNTREEVSQICLLADVDQKSDSVPDPPAAQPTVDPAAAFAPAPMAPPAQPNGSDPQLAALTDEQLSQILEALMPNQGIPAVKVEIERHRAEQIRRQSGIGTQPQAQVPPPAPTAAAPPQPPAISAGPTIPSSPDPEVAGQQLPTGGIDAAGQPRPLANAPVDPGHETPQPSQQGPGPAAQALTEDERRAALMRHVTLGVLETYGKTFQDLEQMPTEHIELMLAAPGVAQQPVSAGISAERAKLEEQITGPMLKAWRRGRVDVVNLSDVELGEMISYPAGPTTRPQGESFLDPSAAFSPTPPALPQAVALLSPPSLAVPGETKERAAAAGVPIIPPSVQVASGSERAMAVIAREKAPIPPDIDDPPKLPGDISKISDEELRSVHGRFHAVESRLNWVISQHEDEIDDLERLKNVRGAEVRNLPREGKAPTKDQMQALIDVDPQVQAYEQQAHEVRKVVNKLKVLRDNAHLTCQRCSREFSMRYGEENPAKRGTP